MRQWTKVERWFDRGADSFARLAPKAPARIYVCPLCGNGYSREAIAEKVITIEHVPPEALGGKPLCLTCRDCNNNAGRGVDAHMHRRETVWAMMRGTMTGFRVPGRAGRDRRHRTERRLLQRTGWRPHQRYSQTEPTGRR